MVTKIHRVTFLFTTLVAQVLAVCTSDLTQSHNTNASGSITFNGFAPPGEAASLYMLSVQVQNYLNISTNQSDTTRQLSLRTAPAQNLSSPAQSWAGCSLVYKLRVPGKAQSTAQSPSTNTCNGHISTACQQALNAAALASAQQLAGNFSRHDEASDEQDQFPSSCQNSLEIATLIQNVPACGAVTEPYYSATGYSRKIPISSLHHKTHLTFSQSRISAPRRRRPATSSIPTTRHALTTSGTAAQKGTSSSRPWRSLEKWHPKKSLYQIIHILWE